MHIIPYVAVTFFFGAGTGSVKAKNGRARLTKPFLYVPIFSFLFTNCKRDWYTYTTIVMASKMHNSISTFDNKYVSTHIKTRVHMEQTQTDRQTDRQTGRHTPYTSPDTPVQQPVK